MKKETKKLKLDNAELVKQKFMKHPIFGALDE
jgi:hypothetical protein